MLPMSRNGRSMVLELVLELVLDQRAHILSAP